MSASVLPMPRSRPDPDQKPEDRLLTTSQVADRWQVHAESVRRLTRSGDLPAIKIGSHNRYRLADVLEFERNNTQERP